MSGLALIGGLPDYTPERWSSALRVLRGETDEGVSWSAAARAAGVPVHRLRAWVSRSREERDEDDPTIWEIHRDVDEIVELQAGRLEDLAWERAVGVEEVTITETTAADGAPVVTTRRVRKGDNKLLLRLLQVRDVKYQPTQVQIRTDVDVSRIFQRLTAEHRLKIAAVEAEFDDGSAGALPSPASVPVGGVDGDTSL